jgi:hypothetical protein
MAPVLALSIIRMAAAMPSVAGVATFTGVSSLLRVPAVAVPVRPILLQRVRFLLELGPLFLDLLMLVDEIARSHQLEAAEEYHLAVPLRARRFW